MLAVAVPARRDAAAAQQRAEARSALREIERGVRAYEAAEGAFPAVSDAGALRERLVPRFLTEMSVKDPWGQPIVVEFRENFYLICSRGDGGGSCEDDLFVTGTSAGAIYRMQMVRALGRAVEKYAQDHGAYPAADDEATLREVLEGR